LEKFGDPSKMRLGGPDSGRQETPQIQYIREQNHGQNTIAS